MFTVNVAVAAVKASIDIFIAEEKLPIEVRKTRDGWAGYKGVKRITKFFFSESGALTAAKEREDALKVKFGVFRSEI